MKDLNFLTSKWFLIIAGAIFVYIVMGLGRTVWKNYQVERQISGLESEITAIGKENQKLSDLIAYFQTESFKEKEAREQLDLVKPGENVVVFPETESENNKQTGPEEENDKSDVPNYQKWMNFFFPG